MTGQMAEHPTFRRRRGRYSVPLRRPAAVTVFLFCLVALLSVGGADGLVLGDAKKAVEIRTPLHGGTHYRPRALARQYRGRFGTALQIEEVSDEPRRLTAGEWAALQVAHLAGLIVVERRADELLLRFPHKPKEGDRRTVSWLEALGVPVPDPWDGLGLVPAIADIDPKSRTVLLIHGLESSTQAMGRFRAAFEQACVQVLSFDYPRRCSVAVAGDRLSSDLNALAQRHPDLRLAIVAHSMGGLVARYVLEAPARNPGCVTDVVFLGTPHQGSRLADSRQVWEVMDGLVWLRERVGRVRGPRWLPVQDGWGEELAPGSPLLAELNRNTRPTVIHYHLAAGRRGLFTVAEHRQFSEEVESLLRRRRVAEGVRASIMAFISSPELVEGLGDGAVSVQSALLPGADTTQVFDRNHVELIRLAENRPEDDALFLWIINTLHWGETRGRQRK